MNSTPPATPGSIWHSPLFWGRLTVMAIAIVVNLFIWTYIIWTYLAYTSLNSGFNLRAIPVNELTRAVFDLKIDHSNNLFSYNVALLGVLWGVIFVSKEGPVLTRRDIPEAITFVLTTLAILANGAFHLLYLRLMGSLANSGGVSSLSTGPSPPDDLSQRFAAAFSVLAGVKSDSSPALTMPDFMSPKINIFAEVQEFTFLGVVVLVGLVIFSLHKLKVQ